MNQIVRAENQSNVGVSNTTEVDAETLAQVVLNGDLTNLAPKDRVTYYNAVCRTVGLNPFTQPFEYLKLNGKLVLYAKRTCSDQLRQIYGVNLAITDKRVEDDLFIVTVQAVNARGRRDEDLGVVSIAGLRGEAKANAILKAITKGKRRVTLSICGLGIMDETEAVDVAGTQFGTVAADGQDVPASRPFIKQIDRESVMPTLDMPTERVPAAVPDTLRAVAQGVQSQAPQMPDAGDEDDAAEVDEDAEKARGFIAQMRKCESDTEFLRLTGSKGAKGFRAWMEENRPDLDAEIAAAQGEVYAKLIAPPIPDAPVAPAAETAEVV